MFRYEIVNAVQQVVRSGPLKAATIAAAVNEAHVNALGLPTGDYTVKLFDGGNVMPIHIEDLHVEPTTRV